MPQLLNYKLIAEHHNMTVAQLHDVLWLAMTGTVHKSCRTDDMFRLFGVSEERMIEWNQRIEQSIRLEKEGNTRCQKCNKLLQADINILQVLSPELEHGKEEYFYCDLHAQAIRDMIDFYKAQE